MKTLTNFLAVVLLTLLATQTLIAEPRIKLTGRKDLVLSVESRATVLDVAHAHLSEKNEDFLALTRNVESPFTFEQAPVITVASGGDGELPAEAPAPAVNYDDASVLRAVAQNFAKKVRGTIARGTTSFLQLNGGNMIKPGTSFPVTIPQAQGQVFTVTISEIRSDSYTLQIGEATQTIRLNASFPSSGSIRMD